MVARGRCTGRHGVAGVPRAAAVRITPHHYSPSELFGESHHYIPPAGQSRTGMRAPLELPRVPHASPLAGSFPHSLIQTGGLLFAICTSTRLVYGRQLLKKRSVLRMHIEHGSKLVAGAGGKSARVIPPNPQSHREKNRDPNQKIERRPGEIEC
jgi:hypothetical protein